MAIRVVLADDQALVRAGFRALLERADDIEVVGEAADGEEALGVVRREVPAVIATMNRSSTNRYRQVALAGTLVLVSLALSAILSGAAGGQVVRVCIAALITKTEILWALLDAVSLAHPHRS